MTLSCLAIAYTIAIVFGFGIGVGVSLAGYGLVWFQDWRRVHRLASRTSRSV